MPCYSPLKGWYSRSRTSTGKRSVVFNPSAGYYDMPVTVSCGQCIGCRLERSRQWALRCVHEASLHDENCFITLTYDDAHLPPFNSLDKTAFPKFMKRLRKAIAPRRVRFYHAGEYGEARGRPHYHACLFGFDFADKREWSIRNGFPVWRSTLLESVWTLGQSEIGSVTFESAAYVARYILKKVLGPESEFAYRAVDEDGVVVERVKEYTTMSRGGRGGLGGIGKRWIDAYMSEVYPSDSVLARGKPSKPPRYYDLAHGAIDPDGAAAVCRARQRARCLEDETPERLAVREECAIARVELSMPRRLV